MVTLNSVFNTSLTKTVLLALLLVLFVGCAGDSPPPTQSTETDSYASTEEESSSESPSNAVASDAVRVLFLGDSITAGYGIDQMEAFPSLVEMRLREAGYNVDAIDAGVSGDTSTGGLNRLDWLLQNRTDVLVLELGGNDGLRGIDLSLTRSNLGAIIERTREAWPSVRVVVVGMQVPPNLGQEYTSEFASMYPELSEEYGTHFVPFLADDFQDIVHLLQNDGIHPTAEGHALIADKVQEVLEPIVAELDTAS